ncbi:MAG: hypothetical protein U1F67_00530 [Rubrivivax sp.]
MSLDRRRFLQGCTGAGLLATSAALGAQPLAMLAAPPAPGARALPRPLVLLRAGGDEHFARAVLRATRPASGTEIESLTLDPAQVRAPGALRAALVARSGATLVGLLDDCTHTLVEEALRDLGASLLCRGQHHGSPSGAAGSRHLFTTTARTAGVGAALAGALAADGRAYLVREQSLSPAVPGADAFGRRLDPRWPVALGDAYARIASGRWDPRLAPAIAQHGTVLAARDARPFVSLIATL